MKYTVRISHAALHRIGEIHEFIPQENPVYADDWLVGLYRTFATLRTLPERGRIAPESPQRGHTVHQILYGKYHVKYVVTPGQVKVTSVRHSGWGPEHEG